ncbi:hypothetical protein SAMN05421810_105197 [Amycolatopsis arida]|uniref:Excreted virulence factor EspC, type VII ESX diderm n=1 Tax=Amycolatopsis arida TaxID=587909 RepID=A0A1I5WNS2_9PSEU|nr:hypothetical protein [Amycolatopsis arida]TDX92371.1 hypothetical protein CLV69_105216 [Amycolatopsis arida]SFQ21359.1 hypothetical protein SAMN05421810_105197 [Amycolatopsis arida]
MSGGFAADPARVAARAEEVAALAERAGAIAAELREALAAGPVWGDDAVGQGFAAAHAGPAEDALAGLAGLGGRFADFGARLAGAAAAYAAGEDAAERDVTDAGAGLG